MRNALALAFLLTFPLYAADYSGRWTLDKAKSADLPPHYEHVVSHALAIEQTATNLNVAVDITTDREPLHMDLPYRLDGTPVKIETKIRTPKGELPVPSTLTAKTQDDGTLAITIERQIGTATATTKEIWHLSEDGRTLTIDLSDHSPRGTFASKYVFVKLPDA